jgi:hypothetical protein
MITAGSDNSLTEDHAMMVLSGDALLSKLVQ